MKIIGLFGLIGSGKDTVADYIQEKYLYKKISFGDIVREFATKEGLDHSRDNLDNLQKRYRDKYGFDFFSKKVVERIKSEGGNFIVNGIRRPEDVEVLIKEFGDDIKLVLIDLDAQTRFKRMKLRKRIGDPETFEEFQRQEKNQFKLFNLDKTIKYMKFKIDNSGSLEDLYRNIDNFMKNMED